MRVAKQLSGAICLIVASLGLACFHPFGNPQRRLQQPRETLLQAVALPESTRRILVTKCADCHSNSTYWPVYSRTAPVSWLIERDVVEGRKHLNLSRWKELPADQQQVLEQEIIQQAREGAMPPFSYRLIHWNAYLGVSDRNSLAALVRTGIIESTPAKMGDADRGRTVFGRRCTGCHSIDSNHEGPRLRGAFGRRAGSIPGFQFSSAIRNSGITWTEANLDRWLTDSDSMLPGSAMGFRVPKAQERSDLIAFLKSLH
jgi:cytochrome c